jgi:hypothetical protein
MFATDYLAEPGDLRQEALFDPHVQSGLLIKRVIEHPFERPIRVRSGRVISGIRRVFFARRGEEWRIDAHLLLWDQLEHGSWNETLERLQGTLLGYTEAQNDWWIARHHHSNASAVFGDRTAYVAVTASEPAWVHAAGDRALPPFAAPELVVHETCPDPTELDKWLATSTAAAVIRFGFAREFLRRREYRDRSGVRCYPIAQHEMPALNRVLTSAIEIVAERTSP